MVSIMLSISLVLFARADARAARPATGSRQLIRDRHFRRGFQLLAPEPGKIVVVGEVRWPGETDEPVWRLAQWSSRFSLAGVTPRFPAPEVMVLANEGKEIIVAPADDPRGELRLTVFGSREYEHPRRKGEKWPHLLLSQRFENPPAISGLKEARFHVEAKLMFCVSHHPEGTFQRGLHAAQYQVFFTIQNLNRRSPGYGDFLYLGVPLYDSRRRFPGSFRQPDWQGKFIFTPSARRYTSQSVHDGTWVTFAADLLPIIRDGLRKAWERGFLAQTHDLADYHLSGMNLGWEIPGIFEASLQIRDLRLDVRNR